LAWARHRKKKDSISANLPNIDIALGLNKRKNWGYGGEVPTQSQSLLCSCGKRCDKK
jgi:hypothetical protein